MEIIPNPKKRKKYELAFKTSRQHIELYRTSQGPVAVDWHFNGDHQFHSSIFYWPQFHHTQQPILASRSNCSDLRHDVGMGTLMSRLHLHVICQANHASVASGA